MAAILLILCAKGVHKVPFLLQYLQVEHEDGKDRKTKRQQVSIQQQDTDIHEVKAEDRRVAAETVNAGCDQLSPRVFVQFVNAESIKGLQMLIESAHILRFK